MDWLPLETDVIEVANVMENNIVQGEVVVRFRREFINQVSLDRIATEFAYEVDPVEMNIDKEPKLTGIYSKMRGVNHYVEQLEIDFEDYLALLKRNNLNYNHLSDKELNELRAIISHKYANPNLAINA